MKSLRGKLKEDAYFHGLDQKLLEKMRHRDRREEKSREKQDGQNAISNVIEFDQSRRKNRQ